MMKKLLFLPLSKKQMKADTIVFFLIGCIVGFSSHTSCKNNEAGSNADRDSYPDQLKLNNKNTFVTDLAAWHAWSVPEPDRPAGKIIGPYLLDSWM
jgi:hypothetical protein